MLGNNFPHVCVTIAHFKLFLLNNFYNILDFVNGVSDNLKNIFLQICFHIHIVQEKRVKLYNIPTATSSCLLAINIS